MPFEQTWIRVHEMDKHIGIKDGDVKVRVSYGCSKLGELTSDPATVYGKKIDGVNVMDYLVKYDMILLSECL